MNQNLRLIDMAGALADHAAKRQAVTTANIANADTPGYRSQTIAPFAETYAEVQTTRPEHIADTTYKTEASPNGNAVSIEQEMQNGTLAYVEQQTALAVYRHSLSVLRAVIGRA